MQEIHLNENKSIVRNNNMQLKQNSLDSLTLMRNHWIPQAFQTSGEKLVTEVQASPIPSNPTTLLKPEGKEIVQQEVENYSKLTQYLQAHFLNNPIATRASRMVAEELIFGAGLLATKFIKFKFPDVAYESLYRNSLAALKKIGKEEVSSTIRNQQLNVLSNLAKKYSALMEENASQVLTKIRKRS